MKKEIVKPLIRPEAYSGISYATIKEMSLRTGDVHNKTVKRCQIE